MIHYDPALRNPPFRDTVEAFILRSEFKAICGAAREPEDMLSCDLRVVDCPECVQKMTPPDPRGEYFDRRREEKERIQRDIEELAKERAAEEIAFILNRDELLAVECALRIVAATDMQFKMKPHMEALLGRIDAMAREVIP